MADLTRIGQNIRKERQKAGITQQALADRMMVSFQAISAWERGLSVPDLENTVRLAECFGVSVDALLTSQDPSLLVGIDGGGTKTEFVAFDKNGNVKAVLRREGSNPNDRGIEASLQVLTNGLKQLLGSRVPVAVFAGIGGVSLPRYQRAIVAHLTEQFHTRVCADSDAANVLSMGKDPENSLAVICGTGSCVFVRKGQRRHRLGGWGYLLDNAGSAYDVGRDGLARTLAAEDGLMEKCLLTEKITAAVGGGIFENISVIYSKGRPYIADLARVVLEAAHAGDKDALEILKRNAQRLAYLLKTAAERYEMPREAVAAGSFLKDPIFRAMVEENAEITICLPETPTVYGACIEAMRMENIPVSDKFEQNFMDSYRRFVC